MRPIKKGEWPLTPMRMQPMSFTDWTRAISILKDRTGTYCHLCERRVTNALAIEHIRNKETFPAQSGDWDNFLLACSACNSRKGEKILEEPYQDHYVWPHLDNSATCFRYDGSGGVAAAPDRTEEVRARSENTINLYQLDATFTSDGGSDIRRVERIQAIRIAFDRRVEFFHGRCTVEAIVDSAILSGFFSIWYAIFQDVDAVRIALVNRNEFKLAATGCFDAEGLVVVGARGGI